MFKDADYNMGKGVYHTNACVDKEVHYGFVTGKFCFRCTQKNNAGLNSGNVHTAEYKKGNKKQKEAL